MLSSLIHNDSVSDTPLRNMQGTLRIFLVEEKISRGNPCGALCYVALAPLIRLLQSPRVLTMMGDINERDKSTVLDTKIGRPP